MSTHYDVIIIGSGAGGGTLFHALAPTGKRILLLERGGYVPREKDNWSTRAVNLEGRYTTKEVWRDRDGRRAAPPHQLLRRRQHQVLRRGAVPPAPRGLRRGASITAGSRRPGRSPTTTSSPTTPRRSTLYHVHGERGEDPTDPPASAPYPHPPVSHEPRIQALADDIARAGPAAVSRAARGDARRARSAQEPVYSLRRPATASPASSHAKSDAQVLCVDPALARYPNASLLTGALVTRLEHEPVGPRGDRRRRRAGRRDRDRTRPTSSWSRPAPSTPRPCCCARPVIGIRSGLANGSGVVGRHYMGHVNSVLMAVSKCPNPTVFQKTLGLNDFYFGLARMGVPDGPHLLRRQARRRHAPRGRPGHRARAGRWT